MEGSRSTAASRRSHHPSRYALHQINRVCLLISLHPRTHNRPRPSRLLKTYCSSANASVGCSPTHPPCNISFVEFESLSSAASVLAKGREIAKAHPIRAGITVQIGKQASISSSMTLTALATFGRVGSARAEVSPLLATGLVQSTACHVTSSTSCYDGWPQALERGHEQRTRPPEREDAVTPPTRLVSANT
ncbi:hypothetical protein BD309DRAFT_212455 [Dichomitus squalens]|uniref:Uncharacterized protein n=1 Tax=Dichomitus squalens TaxID=114155 RepID=A0A4Q9PLV1_9APHY|nr:hypothetical protein BD309DRAFT_212455 [Dichomitus squalens]TBU55190.1 hypothetical protein BD310DRAFT_706703 [Dichomitus squalens]